MRISVCGGKGRESGNRQRGRNWVGKASIDPVGRFWSTAGKKSVLCQAELAFLSCWMWPTLAGTFLLIQLRWTLEELSVRQSWPFLAGDLGGASLHLPGYHCSQLIQSQSPGGP